MNRRKAVLDTVLRDVAFAAAAALIVVAVGCGSESEPVVMDVTPEQVVSFLDAADGPLILDVRTSSEFSKGRVPGAINIPHTELAARLSEIETQVGRGIVVYCERGGRAETATDILVAAGFQRVMHLDGDMSGWRSSNLPIEKPE